MKRILFAMIVLGLLNTPTVARQWNSRNGGFSVEAELLDVKDGNAVLKKNDGSQISIPLSKLSLSDVRYINGVLKEAESGVTGATPETTTNEKPQSGDTPPPADASKFDFKKLRYGWKKGQSYVYRVKIKGDRGYYSQYYAGNVTYKVKSDIADEITLGMTANMTRGDQLMPIDIFVYVTPDPTWNDPLLLSRSYSPRFLVRNSSNEPEITTNRLGEIDHIKGDAQLPFLLGDLSQLMIEPLSNANKSTWTIANDTGVCVVGMYYPFYRYWGVRIDGSVPASEKTTYTIKNQSDDTLTIAKHYELTTGNEMVGGKPRFEATGNGTLVFDTKRGVPGSMDYQMQVTVRAANRTEEAPVHITYRLLTDEEIAAEKKDTEEAKKKEEQEKKEKLRPLTDKEIEIAIADLTSEDVQRIIASEKLLAEKKPKEPHPQVAKALESLMLTSDNGGIRSDAAKALNNWSTPENVPSLMKAINDEWSPVQSAAIETLIHYKPKDAIKPVAQLINNNFTRGAAIKFLKAMGPDAEDAVIEQFRSTSDAWALADMCKLLETIGTKKSLPTLEKAVMDENWMINGNARKAVAAIKKRP